MAKNVYKILLTGDTSHLKKALGGVSMDAQTTGGKFVAMGKMGGLALATVGVAAVGAFAGFTKASVDSFQTAARETMKFQRLTGGTAEDMSRLRFVAQQTGQDTEKLATSMVRFSKNAMGPAKDTLADLGISLKDASGQTRPYMDLLKDLAGQFERMPNGMEKNALAVKLFGKAGADMIPMLNRGSEGIAELMAKSDQFGWTLGQGNVDDMKKNIAAQRDWQAAWEGLKIQWGANVQPMLTAMAVWLAEKLPIAIDWLKEKWKEWGPTVIAVLQSVGRFFVSVFQGIKGWIDDHKVQIASIAARVWEVMQAVWGYMQGAWDTIRMVWDAGVELVRGIWDRMGHHIIDRLRNWGAALLEIFRGLWEMVAGVFDFFRSVFTGKWGEAWDALHRILEGWRQVVTGLWHNFWNGVLAILQGAWGLLGGLWSWMWESIKRLAALAWDGIVAIVRWGIAAFLNFMAELPFKVRAFFSDAGQWLQDAGLALLRGLKAGAQWAWGEVWEFLSGIPGRIAGAVGDLGSKLLDAGRAVIGGLLRGIKEKFEEVKNFVQGIGTWIADHKGPLDYDRKLLQPAGQALMAGLGEGLAGGWRQVQRQVAGMAPSLQGQVAASVVAPSGAAAAGMAGAGGGGTVYNINVTTGVGDKYEIGRYVVDVLQTYEGRNGRAWRESA